MSIRDRGFASMDRQKQREIASLGGKTAHERGTAYQWTKVKASEAGKLGGKASALARERKRRDQSGTTDSGNMNYPPA